MFLFATNEEFYETLRAAIASIQKVFGDNFQKIIVYDLGGISTNVTRVKFNCKIDKKLINNELIKFANDCYSFFFLKNF